jgi:hypothetical protein
MNPAVKKRDAVWAVWVACVLAAALALAAIVVDFLPGQSQRLSLRIADWFFIAVAVPFAVVGALIAVHRPGNRLGGLLLVGALALGAEKLLSANAAARCRPILAAAGVDTPLA